MGLSDFIVKFREFDKRLARQLDVNTHLPGYATKSVFRSAFVLAGLLILVTLWSNGWDFSTHQYVWCPADSPFVCDNPFYGMCSDALCQPEKVLPGQTIGVRPSWLADNALGIMLSIFVVAAVVNHCIYEVKLRRG